MDNETKKMFEILMNKLDNIEETQKSMQISQRNMQISLGTMEESQRNMQIRLGTIEETQKSMQIRQDEMFSVVKAIEHSNTTHKAEIDNIIYKVAHTEGTIYKIGDVIEEYRAVK